MYFAKTIVFKLLKGTSKLLGKGGEFVPTATYPIYLIKLFV